MSAGEPTTRVEAATTVSEGVKAPRAILEPLPVHPVASTPAANDDDDREITIWGLIAGIIGGTVVGGAAGAVLGRRSSG